MHDLRLGDALFKYFSNRVLSCAFLACFDLNFCYLDILSLEFSFLGFKNFYCLSLGSLFCLSSFLPLLSFECSGRAT